MNEIDQSQAEPETTSALQDAADVPAAAFSAVEEVVAVSAPESAIVAPTFGESAAQVIEQPYVAPSDMGEETPEEIADEDMISEGAHENASDNSSASAEASEEAKEEDPYRCLLYTSDAADE